MQTSEVDISKSMAVTLAPKVSAVCLVSVVVNVMMKQAFVQCGCLGRGCSVWFWKILECGCVQR